MNVFIKILLCLALAFLVFFLIGNHNIKKRKNDKDSKENIIESRKTSTSERVSKKPDSKVSYGPKVDPIIQEGNRALSEMGRLYGTIKDESVRSKINEIMLITDKIMQDAIEDPNDVPQIKKFFSYYLPTTIKLLNTYDRMGSKEIESDNLSKTMENIDDMLDVAIEAYKKRLDSLFENQALDIETDIDVMNQMLAKEGLIESKGVF